MDIIRHEYNELELELENITANKTFEYNGHQYKIIKIEEKNLTSE